MSVFVTCVQDCLRHCHEQIEATVRDSVCSDASNEESPSPLSGNEPFTPTDVRDINLLEKASSEHMWLNLFKGWVNGSKPPPKCCEFLNFNDQNS